MKIAVISDIHGNLLALEAVLEDLKHASPDLIVNLGDCVSGPLWPEETAALLAHVEQAGDVVILPKRYRYKGETRTPEYLAINPNGTLPAITDRDGPGGRPLKIMESGAILHYLALKTGTLIPEDPAKQSGLLDANGEKTWRMRQLTSCSTCHR